MRQSAVLLVAAGLVCACATASAQESESTGGATAAAPAPRSTHGAAVRFGTDGFGLAYTFGLNRYVDLRAGYQFGAYSYTDTEDGTDYKAKLKLNALTGMVDIKPFAGGFRVSAGLYGKAPELDMHAHGYDDYDIGDETYRGDLALKGHTDLGKVSPYLGIGWGGTSNGKGFGVSFDMGVIFGKSPKIDLAASGMACNASADPSCDPNGPEGFDVNDNADFQAELEKERKNIEDDAKDYRYWPVLNLGLHYRF
ncbi:hypothetical protein [Solimonas marina]|uniref:Outer membrane protein beta-barrel domain-containing protein n=1 Tax=Solimonas marina TaxID=2714601 RepID=A0A970B5N7_9GAMM|nr:hypothetical protein [Solimonas marina]NKF21908.1 hypothetical protein [Solimonas marina]